MGPILIRHQVLPIVPRDREVPSTTEAINREEMVRKPS
jgi:hypothetical protein